MSQALSQYFAREAGEYLAEMERLLRTSERPDAERIFRLARGVRGSAQVAQADGVAEVAARLEGAARFVLEGRIPWSDELRDRALRTVSDLTHLVAVEAREWGGEEDERVSAALSRWGGFEDIVHTPTGVEPAAAVTSFVRTEISALGSELDIVIGSLRTDPSDHSVLQEVVRRIRTLRGVAGSEPIAASLELLEGCDEQLRTAISRGIPIAGERLEMLEAARSAIRAVESALDADRPPPSGGAELERFRTLRSRVAGEPTDSDDATIVPIHTLLFDDQGPTVISSPIAPVSPVPAGSDAGDVEGFLRGEVVSVLDSAEGLLAGAEMHPATDTQAVLRRVSEIVGSLSDLAKTYRAGDLAEVSSAAKADLGSARSTDAARSALADLRNRLVQEGADGYFSTRTPPAGPAPPQPPATAASTADELDVVPIESLLIRGDAALDAALRLRGRIEALVGPGAVGRGEIGLLLEELWDLIELGRSEESTR
jgi:HPt (histidine-containing phosphotransfer) domain-containing protein